MSSVVPNCLQRTHTGFAKRGKKTFLSFFLFVYLFCSLQSSLEISVRGAECQGFANCEVLYSGGFCGLRASSSYPGSFRPSLLRSEREAWLETTSPGSLCKLGGCPGVWPPQLRKNSFAHSFIQRSLRALPVLARHCTSTGDLGTMTCVPSPPWRRGGDRLGSSGVESHSAGTWRPDWV